MKYTVEVSEEGIFWYKEGTEIPHREDGPAVECLDGTKYWYKNGKLHREDGPAYEHASGYKEWWVNGNLHREDGPTVEEVDGDKKWFINGKQLTEEEFNNRTQKSYTIEELRNMSIEELHKIISD